MIWPSDIEIAYTMWRETHTQIDGKAPPRWVDLNADTRRVMTAMYQAGMHEAASLCDEAPHLRDDIIHHAQIGEEVMKK